MINMWTQLNLVQSINFIDLDNGTHFIKDTSREHIS